jgi:activator of HSP90 ATPase
MKLEEPEQGTTILTLHHTGIPHEDKYGNSDVEGTTRNGWQQLILHRIKAVFGYGL